ncbi:MAG: hypothetical protein ACTSP4_15070, partial [Candidatus Hodarchaeales archaeon]
NLVDLAMDLYRLKKSRRNWQPRWYYLIQRQNILIPLYLCFPAFPDNSSLPGPRELLSKGLSLVERFYSRPLRLLDVKSLLFGEIDILSRMYRKYNADSDNTSWDESD